MPNYENNFNNFKIHSQYSICEGAIKIDDLADYCKINKIKSIGLADSFNLCGALEFSEKISKVGTQPIIGTQINIIDQNVIGKISLYATSEIGYKNLTKLSSLSYLKNTENKGVAAACNHGAQIVESDWVLFLNPDTKLPENCFRDFRKY